MEMHIREFHYPEDYFSVWELWQNAGAGINLRHSDSLDEIRKKLQRDPDLFLLAEEDGKLVATVMGGFDGRRGMVYHLAVADGYRKRGIGEALMVEVEQRLKEKGCIRCYLLITIENETAMHFYEQRGWTHMENVKIYGKDLE
jgi:ribosomal protein S18 acetylase RimI-like enzyme